MRQICMSGSMSGVWKRSHGRTSEAPPDERGGNSYARPTATAPHSDSTIIDPRCPTNRTAVVGPRPGANEPKLHAAEHDRARAVCFDDLTSRRQHPVRLVDPERQAQQAFGALYPALDDIALRPNPCSLLKGAAEVIGAQTGD